MHISAMKISDIMPILKLRNWEVDEFHEEVYMDRWTGRRRVIKHVRVVDENGEAVTKWHFTKITALRNALRSMQDESIS